MIGILLADDEERIRRILGDFLRREGFWIVEAVNGQDAFEKFIENQSKISLIILDIMMPVLDGWAALKKIREYSKEVCIMMLTAKTEDEDQLHGFMYGADDYVLKPVSPLVLVARVKALLKRSHEKYTSKRYDYNGIIIDEKAHSVFVDSKEIYLSPKEYDLLSYLALNNRIALSREQILNTIWGYNYSGDLRTLDAHIKNLRAKLGFKGDSIKTLRGYGYKFDASQCKKGE